MLNDTVILTVHSSQHNLRVSGCNHEREPQSENTLPSQHSEPLYCVAHSQRPPPLLFPLLLAPPKLSLGWAGSLPSRSSSEVLGKVVLAQSWSDIWILRIVEAAEEEAGNPGRNVGFLQKGETKSLLERLEWWEGRWLWIGSYRIFHVYFIFTKSRQMYGFCSLAVLNPVHIFMLCISPHVYFQECCPRHMVKFCPLSMHVSSYL